jgi:membrane protease YdiL (CAAX protease family)
MTEAMSYPRLGQALVLALLVIVFQLIIGVAIGVGMPGIGIALPLAASVGFANVLSFGLVIWWAVLRTGLPLAEALPFPAVRATVYLPMIVMVVGLGIVSSEVDNLFRSLVPVPRFIADIFRDIGSAGMISLITLVVVAPVTEELLFRGTILRGFLGRYGARKAIVLSALIFCFIHLNPYQFFSAFVLGLALGWIFARTGSLWPCLVGHAFYNAHGFLIAALLPVKIPGYNPETIDLAVVEFQPLWFDVLGLLAIAVGFSGLARIFQRTRPAG